MTGNIQINVTFMLKAIIAVNLNVIKLSHYLTCKVIPQCNLNHVVLGIVTIRSTYNVS